MKPTKKLSSALLPLLHLIALFVLAVAQPLFDLLVRNTEFLAIRRAETSDIIALIVILCLILPGLLVIIQLLFRLAGQRMDEFSRAFFIATLSAVLLLPVFKRFGVLPGIVTSIGAVIAGGLFAFSYFRFSTPRAFLTLLTPSIVIVPFLFFTHGQITKLRSTRHVPITIVPHVDANTPVFLIIFDELPLTSLMNEESKIDRIRYPNFGRLAEASIWYRNATTVADGTIVAVPAILSGNYSDFAHPTAVNYPRNLFTWLGGTYELNVTETLTSLCPETQLNSQNRPKMHERMIPMLMDLSAIYLHLILPEDFSALVPSVNQTWGNFWAPDLESKNVQKVKKAYIPDRERAFLDSLPRIGNKTKKPLLYYHHINLPHIPYEYLPSGLRYDSRSFGPMGMDGINKNGKWQEDEWLAARGYQRHLLQLGFVDTLTGKFIDRLQETGLWDRSLVIVTADHGASYTPGQPARSVVESNRADILLVPLFLKLPSDSPNSNRGVISDMNIETIDILPTIADALNVDLPWKVDGQSILEQNTKSCKRALQIEPKKRWLEFETIDHQQTLKRKLALFGVGSYESLFRSGPQPELISQRIDHLKISGDAPFTAEMKPPVPDNVDLTSGVIPCFIRGRLRMNGTQNPQQMRFAIAVNGVIRAVTRGAIVWTFPFNELAEEFGAVIPESSFQDGRNRLEIFVRTESSQESWLRVKTTYASN